MQNGRNSNVTCRPGLVQLFHALCTHVAFASGAILINATINTHSEGQKAQHSHRRHGISVPVTDELGRNPQCVD